MNNSAYIEALGYAFLGLLIAFTICQALLLRPRNRVPIYLWIIGTAFSVTSVIGSRNLLTIYSNEVLTLWAANASLAAGVFKYAALSFPSRSFARDRLSNALIFASMVAMPIAVLPSLAPYRLLMTSIIGVSICFACARAAYRNRYWASPYDFGRGLVITAMGISALMLVVRGLTSYPFGEDRFYIGPSSLQLLSLGVFVVISLLSQIGFIGMLIARHDKASEFIDRRHVRAWQRSALLAKRGQSLRALAKQRLDLIQLLTHEVRQPINNAQASLQSITPDLDKASLISDRANHALDRSKTSLDGITRALSNVILAGTLVADDQNWSRQQIDAMEILEMARLDCNPANQKRIVVAPPHDHIFIECVPTLLRVALHNILEHALNFVDGGENISVLVTADDVKLGVAFTITGNMNQQKINKTDASPERRGMVTASPKMASFGLFVANLVAQNHRGECSIETDSSGMTKIVFFVR